MLAHMEKPLTESITLSFEVPGVLKAQVLQYMHSLGCKVQEEEEQGQYSIEEVFPYTKAEIPAVCLRGARYREGLTQAQLAAQTGIAPRHISEMEHGKRPIGKQNAKKLASVLNINPMRLIAL